MNKNQKTKEKACAFYASDYHFEMISLPYINKKIEEDNDVVILTENNLEETIKTLISKMNLKEENKKKIFSIDWTNNDLYKFKIIKSDVENDRNIIIFIKGKQNYIKNINRNIEKWVKGNSNIKIIDCYDIEEISDKMDKVMQDYKNVLNTTGEKKI